MTDQTFDPFDPAALRLPQDFAETANVKKLLTSVPVRKPNKQDFIRVHPSEDFRMSPVGIIDHRDDREIYLVAPGMTAELANEFVPVTIYLAVNRQGVPFFWPVRLPGGDRRNDNDWARVAREAAELAMIQWIRLVPNLGLGAYEVSVAMNGLPDPVWPDVSFRELLKVAFRGKLIDTADHPVVRRLRGLE